MPTPGILEAETNDSVDLNKMTLASAGISVLSMKTEGVYVFMQRNIMAQKALDLECTHVMFVDNDMVFPEDTIMRLLAHDKDIVTTNYVVKMKRGKCRFAAMDSQFKEVRLEAESTGLQKVYAAPTGTMLIKTEVFKKLPKGWWFHHGWNKASQEYMGEDTHFCNLANEFGYDVWIDSDLSKQIEHIGKKAFNWKDCY